MDKKERFAIAKKIARGEQLTKEEQSFANNYVNNLLKECIIK